MPSAHKHPPIPFRPPERDRVLLLKYAEQTGRPVNAILTEALREYLSGNAAAPPAADQAETNSPA